MGLIRKAAAVPAPPVVDEPCAACGADDTLQRVTHSEGRLMRLCVDAGPCCVRYRRGLTPTMFASMLRAETAGVTA